MPEGFSLKREGTRQLLSCQGVCDRNTRPLACRIFPLLPILKGDGVKVVLDKRGYAVCPLLPHGISAFSQAFHDEVKKVGELLYQYPEHKALLDSIHAEIAAYSDMQWWFFRGLCQQCDAKRIILWHPLAKIVLLYYTIVVLILADRTWLASETWKSEGSFPSFFPNNKRAPRKTLSTNSLHFSFFRETQKEKKTWLQKVPKS